MTRYISREHQKLPLNFRGKSWNLPPHIGFKLTTPNSTAHPQCPRSPSTVQRSSHALVASVGAPNSRPRPKCPAITWTKSFTFHQCNFTFKNKQKMYHPLPDHTQLMSCSCSSLQCSPQELSMWLEQHVLVAPASISPTSTNSKVA